MAEWKCATCGHIKEGRCKPKRCPECGETGFTKEEAREDN